VILLPNDFVRNIATMAADVASLGQLRLLLVRLDSPSGVLATTLEASLRRDDDWSPPTDGKTSRTASGIPESQSRPIPRTGPLHDAAKLRSALNGSPHFATILAKRRRSTSPRITVGRARAMDIVLKHPSVSSSHAWLDCDEEGVYFVRDNDSTNGTRVNGAKLQPGTLFDLAPGDAIRFGDVIVIYSLAKTLHQALNLR
jgi:hypothetical protein